MATQIDPGLLDQEHESAYRAIFEASSDGLVINDPETGVVLEANPAFCSMHGYESMTGLYPTTFIHPDSHHLFEAYVSAIREGHEFRCRALDVRRDGTTLNVEVRGRSFTYQGRSALLGVVRDVTEQVHAYQELEQRVAERTREIERRREVAESLRDLLAVVNSGRTLDEILLAVLAQTGRLLGNQTAAIHLLDQEGAALEMRAIHGPHSEPVARRIPVGVPASGLAALKRRPVAFNDLRAALQAALRPGAQGALEDRAVYLNQARLGPPRSDADWLDYRRLERLGQSHAAMLAVPMLIDGQLRGTITLYYAEPREFGEEEVALVTAFADQAALAIENTRLRADAGQRTHEAQQRLSEVEALYRADQALHRSLVLEDVLQALCDLAAEILKAEKTAVWTWDEHRQGLVVSAAHAISPEFRTLAFPIDEAASQTLTSGDVVVVEDLRTEHQVNPAFRAAVDREGIRSYLSATIRLADQVFGSFAAAYGEPRTFGDRDRRLLLALAQRAGLAIENARLYQQSEKRRHEIEALYLADERIYRSLQLDEVLQALADVASDLLQPDKVSVGILDEQTGRVVVGAARGFTQTTLAESLTPEESRQLREYLVGGVVIMNDGQPDPQLPASIVEANRREGIRSSMAAPIQIGSEVLGGFGLSYCQPRTFSREDQRLLATLAQRAGLAIQNARLHKESEQRRQEVEALYHADEALHRSLHLDEVLQTLVDLAATILQSEVAGVWTLDVGEQRMIVRASRGMSPTFVDGLNAISRLDEGTVARDVLRSDMQVITDVRTDPRFSPRMRALIEAEDLHATLSVPIRIGEQEFGTFAVGFRESRTFSGREQRMLVALGNRAALAIQNARLYEQVQQAATLEERQRLARELHDAVTQTLFSTALIAEVIPDLWDVDPEEGRRRLEELRKLTRGALAEMRTLLVELRPGALTELPLEDLLRQLGEATAGRTHLAVAVRADRQDSVEMPAEVRVALYRIAQEALNNIVKHAQAHQASVRLDHHAAGEVSLRIEDDGRGFDVATVPAGHLGVGIMRERARAIGATIRLESAPGMGTRVEISWQGHQERS